jgi:phosphohistidine swiveling domain-containing protein
MTYNPAKPNIIDGKEWNLTVTRNMSFWHDVLMLSGCEFNTIDYGIPIGPKILYFIVDGTKTSSFANQEVMSLYTEAIKEAFSTKEKVELMKARYNEFADETFKSLEELNQSITPVRLELFFDAYQRMTASLFITTIWGRVGTELLTQKLKEKGLSDSEIPEIIGNITYPEDHTPLFDSQLGMMQIAALAQSGELKEERLTHALEQWLERFGAIPVNFCEEAWTMKDAHDQLKSFLAKNCQEELVRAEEGHVQRIKDAKEKLDELNNEEISTLAFALAQGTYLNEFRKNVFCRVSLGYRKVFTEIAKIAGSNNWRDCFYLLPKEMVAILSDEEVDLKGIVASRKKVAVYIKDLEVTLLDNDVVNGLDTYVKNLYGAKTEEVSDGQKALKGFSASKGKVQGIARIILSSKDFDRLNPGEILVTTMTSVDFVPVMERAGAFVTNEGGITSHASIVAREMGKPCIIGTKNGTQVIKDGDLVEVDATKGLVTILN